MKVPQKSFRIWLNDIKVYKRFGRKPELGRPLPFLPKKKVTVGVRWSLPRKDYVPDTDVLVTPSVALKRLSKDFWEVQCDAAHWPKVQNYLCEVCR